MNGVNGIDGSTCQQSTSEVCGEFAQPILSYRMYNNDMRAKHCFCFVSGARLYGCSRTASKGCTSRADAVDEGQTGTNTGQMETTQGPDA